MMAAIYYGAMYGGSTTAIVSTSPAKPRPSHRHRPPCDGKAGQGRAGPRHIRHLLLRGRHPEPDGADLLAPVLANFALAFGPPEYFALMFMGLSLVMSLSGRALLKGIISMSLGLTASLIGNYPVPALPGLPSAP